MNARSMIAGAALIALAAGCCPRAATPTRIAPANTKEPVRLTEKPYGDDDGNTVTVRFGGAMRDVATEVKVADQKGNPVDVREITVTDASVCVPRAQGSKETFCQPAKSMSDGSFLKMGTATCTCYVYAGKLWCYGSTCTAK